MSGGSRATWLSRLILLGCLSLAAVTAVAFPAEPARFVPQLFVEGTFLLVSVVGLLLLPRVAVSSDSQTMSLDRRIYVPLLVGFGGYAVRGTTDVLDELRVVPQWYLTVFKDVALVLGSLAFVLGLYWWAQNRIRRERTLRRREAELEQQNRRLETFASVVSHDLRNPLNVARGHAESMDDERADEITVSLDRMETIIGDVLELTRLGSDALDTEPVDLDVVARDAWRSVETDGASLRTEAATVVADRSLLQQLLENLFRNSLEHGRDDDAPPLLVAVGPTEAGFFVADDGRGIPSDECSNIFRAGYSTDDAGTGLGLSIVSEIADTHGWSVEVVTDGASPAGSVQADGDGEGAESDADGVRFEFDT